MTTRRAAAHIWSSILALVIAGAAFTARADELTLYFYPSAKGLDFETPKSLAKTTVANELASDPHSIGHVNVEVNCAATDEAEPVYILTGATNADSGEPRRLLLEERYGLGILFHNFPGKLYDADTITAELDRLYQSGGVSFVTWKINAQACARLAQYVKEYKERGYDQHYGLPNRPLEGEGAGCSAFGASFVELAGLMDSAYLDGWRRFLRVPKQYVGGPLTGRRVFLSRLLFGLRRTRWAEADEAHFPIHFWDPELMHAWVLGVWQGRGGAPDLPVERVRRQGSLGLVMDATQVPVPNGPIWRE